MFLRHGSHALLLTLAMFGCVPIELPAQDTQPASPYSAPSVVCRITDARIDEASGLAASRRNPGLYYTHNDSAGKPHVYAIDRAGRIRATIRLIGAANLDWEDVAIAPGTTAGEFDVCVADIGDNKSRRERVTIYRFPEPEIGAATAGGNIDLRPTIYRCKYENGPRNAEGFAVDPRSGDGFIFSKRKDGRCNVYLWTAPWKADKTTTLKKISSLRFPAGLPLSSMVTGADISPDGLKLATRAYAGGWEWRLPANANKFAEIFKQTPAAIELAVEQQGEAVCYTCDGNALLTISEGVPTAVNEVRAENVDEPLLP